jgi:hypothetical protein
VVTVIGMSDISLTVVPMSNEDDLRHTCVMCGEPLPRGPRRLSDHMRGYYPQGLQCDRCAAENGDRIDQAV